MLRKALLLVAVAGCVLLAAGAGEAKKPWLIIETPPSSAGEGTGNDALLTRDFPRLLLMQISKAGVFRCADRETYRTQSKENALGDEGDIELKSAGYCISWVIRSRISPMGTTLTISLGYNNIGRNGNGELIRSEDVIVRERNVKGGDLLTAAAKKAAQAILFSLEPPEVLEVQKSKSGKSGKTEATVTYGKDFFSVGDKVYFEKKTIKKGHTLLKKVGLGTVTSTELDTSTVLLLQGTVEEENILEMEKKDEASVCPACNGSKRAIVKCGTCNGIGKVRRRTGITACPACSGRGSLRLNGPCSACGGTGKVKD